MFLGVRVKRRGGAARRGAAWPAGDVRTYITLYLAASAARYWREQQQQQQQQPSGGSDAAPYTTTRSTRQQPDAILARVL